ncbi:MAG: gamma-glutamyl-gamma-aminobutyrate hydrolase family protein, partial [Rhodospirillaceae bacterium]|nr:gamma-glutamyl-gamma-aminobutyrate hydrolase family protein [Rhodospirillaceae bacterium]
MRTKPVVAVSTCVKDIGGFDYFCVNDKYISALMLAADVIPILLPPVGSNLEIDEILEICDGLYLTGSVSNVEPHHYGGEASEAGTLHDP